jgi:hypothetical protein
MSRVTGEAAPEAAADVTSAGHRGELLRQMLLIRRFEEKCVELYSASEIRGFVHLYIGEEAFAVGVNQALTPADSIVSRYREHGGTGCGETGHRGARRAVGGGAGTVHAAGHSAADGQVQAGDSALLRQQHRRHDELAELDARA